MKLSLQINLHKWSGNQKIRFWGIPDRNYWLFGPNSAKYLRTCFVRATFALGVNWDYNLSFIKAEWLRKEICLKHLRRETIQISFDINTSSGNTLDSLIKRSRQKNSSAAQSSCVLYGEKDNCLGAQIKLSDAKLLHQPTQLLIERVIVQLEYCLSDKRSRKVKQRKFVSQRCYENEK